MNKISKIEQYYLNKAKLAQKATEDKARKIIDSQKEYEESESSYQSDNESESSIQSDESVYQSESSSESSNQSDESVCQSESASANNDSESESNISISENEKPKSILKKHDADETSSNESEKSNVKWNEKLVKKYDYETSDYDSDSIEEPQANIVKNPTNAYKNKNLCTAKITKGVRKGQRCNRPCKGSYCPPHNK